MHGLAKYFVTLVSDGQSLLDRAMIIRLPFGEVYRRRGVGRTCTAYLRLIHLV